MTMRSADSATRRSSRCPIRSSSCFGTGGGPARRRRSGWRWIPSRRCAGAGCTISWAMASTATAPTGNGSSPTSRRCSTTRPSSRSGLHGGVSGDGRSGPRPDRAGDPRIVPPRPHGAGRGILRRGGCRQRRGGGALLPVADGRAPPAPRSGRDAPGGGRLRARRGGQFHRSRRRGSRTGTNILHLAGFGGRTAAGHRDDGRSISRSPGGDAPPAPGSPVRESVSAPGGTTRSWPTGTA